MKLKGLVLFLVVGVLISGAYYYRGNDSTTDNQIAHHITSIEKNEQGTLPTDPSLIGMIRSCTSEQVLSRTVASSIKGEVESRFDSYLNANRNFRLAVIATELLNIDLNLGKLYERQIFAEAKKARSSLPILTSDKSIQTFRDSAFKVAMAFEREDISTFKSTLATSQFHSSVVEVRIGNDTINLSPFGMLLHKRRTELASDDYDSVLELSAKGFSPTPHDIAYMILFDYSLIAIEAAITESSNGAAVHDDLNAAIYINNNLRIQTLLSLAIMKESPEVVDLVLKSGIRHLGFAEVSEWRTIMGLNDKKLSRQILVKLLREKVTPLKKAESEAIIEFFDGRLDNDLNRTLTFSYASLNDFERWQIDALTEVIESRVYEIIQVHHGDLSIECYEFLAGAYLRTIDWNSRDLKIEQPKPMFAANNNNKKSDSEPNLTRIEFDYKLPTANDNETFGVHEKRHVNLDLDEATLKKLIEAALSQDFETVDLLLKAAKNFDSNRSDEVVMQLMLSVLAKNDEKFLQYLPELDYMNESLLATAFVFDNPLEIIKAMRANGLDINQRFSGTNENLLIQSARQQDFESFQFLLDVGLDIRPSENFYDAVDLSIVRLAEDGDWRYLDAVMATNPELRMSNSEALAQLATLNSALHEQVVEKYSL